MNTKCERCGTEYLEPVVDCDWCPGVVPQPMEQQPEPEKVEA